MAITQLPLPMENPQIYNYFDIHWQSFTLGNCQGRQHFDYLASVFGILK